MEAGAAVPPAWSPSVLERATVEVEAATPPSQRLSDGAHSQGCADSIRQRAGSIRQCADNVGNAPLRCSQDLPKSVVAVALPETGSGVARNGSVLRLRVGRGTGDATTSVPQFLRSSTSERGPAVLYATIRSRVGSSSSEWGANISADGRQGGEGGREERRSPGRRAANWHSQSRDSHMSEIRITCREDPPTTQRHSPTGTRLAPKFERERTPAPLSEATTPTWQRACCDTTPSDTHASSQCRRTRFLLYCCAAHFCWAHRAQRLPTRQTAFLAADQWLQMMPLKPR